MKPMLAIGLLAWSICMPTFAQSSNEQIVGAWIVSQSVDEMTDERMGSMLQLSEGESEGLMIRCAAGELSVFIAWQEYMGGDTLVDVMHRLPPDTPETSRWSLSTDNTATFHRQPLHFAAQLNRHSGTSDPRVIFRATPCIRSLR